jgi:uncharacterized protein YacL
VVLLRAVFLILALGLAAAYAHTPALASTILGVALGAVILDLLFQAKDLVSAVAVYLGVAAGLLLACLIGLVLQRLPWKDDVSAAVQALLAIVLSYACVSVSWQSRKELRGWFSGRRSSVPGETPLFGQPWLLDTSAVIDGRIADVVETGAVGGPLIAPAFVVAELQRIADNSDRSRRARGRRGLDVLNRLRNNPRAQLQIDERELPEFEGQPVDTRLVLLARHLGAKVVTHDYNLNKVAQVHGIEVVNLNDLAQALKPVFLPGEQLEVHLIKAGEAAGQGIGYLDDGTMIVVEGGRDRLNETVKVTVTSVLQTSAGRMIFGKS